MVVSKLITQPTAWKILFVFLMSNKWIIKLYTYWFFPEYPEIPENKQIFMEKTEHRKTSVEFWETVEAIEGQYTEYIKYDAKKIYFERKRSYLRKFSDELNVCVIQHTHILGAWKKNWNENLLTVIFEIAEFIYCNIMRIKYQTKFNQIFKMAHSSPNNGHLTHLQNFINIFFVKRIFFFGTHFRTESIHTYIIKRKNLFVCIE